MGAFKRSSFLPALEAGVPVVPLSLVGVKRVARGGLRVRAGRVRLVVHAPIPTAGRDVEEARALAEEVRRVVRDGMRGGVSLARRRRARPRGRAAPCLPAAAADKRGGLQRGIDAIVDAPRFAPRLVGRRGAQPAHGRGGLRAQSPSATSSPPPP